jgi:hypothetical protein
MAAVIATTRAVSTKAELESPDSGVAVVVGASTADSGSVAGDDVLVDELDASVSATGVSGVSGASVVVGAEVDEVDEVVVDSTVVDGEVEEDTGVPDQPATRAATLLGITVSSNG